MPYFSRIAMMAEVAHLEAPQVVTDPVPILIEAVKNNSVVDSAEVEGPTHPVGGHEGALVEGVEGAFLVGEGVDHPLRVDPRPAVLPNSVLHITARARIC